MTEATTPTPTSAQDAGRDPALRAPMFAALAQAQGSFLPIEKNREGRKILADGEVLTYRYADLEEIISKTRPALSANGLALITLLEDGAHDEVAMRSILAHSSGYSISASLTMRQGDHEDDKDFGARVSLMRRYQVQSMLGVAAEDDSATERNPHPVRGADPELASIAEARTVSELSKVYAALSRTDRAKHTKQYERRMAELKEAKG